jgi:hypothetical protein
MTPAEQIALNVHQLLQALEDGNTERVERLRALIALRQDTLAAQERLVARPDRSPVLSAKARPASAS